MGMGGGVSRERLDAALAGRDDMRVSPQTITVQGDGTYCRIIRDDPLAAEEKSNPWLRDPSFREDDRRAASKEITSVLRAEGAPFVTGNRVYRGGDWWEILVRVAS